MGLYKRLLNRTVIEPEEAMSAPIVDYLDKSDFPSVFFQGYITLDKHPEFVAGIEKIADLISNMTIHVMEKDKKGHETRVRDEFARKLDINPNKWMTRKTYINNLVKQLLLYGNQVTIPAYTRDGLLDNLIPIENYRLDYERTKFGYRIKIDDKEYKPENLLHFVLNPDPQFPYRGQGYRIILKDVLDNLSTAGKTKKGYMQQKYQPSMIVAVESDGSADKESWATAKKRMIEDYLTSTSAGAPFIIPSNMMNVQSISPLTLNDIAINESVEIDKKTVAAVLGIPAFILGVGEFNRDEYNNFIETKIKTIAKIIEQEKTLKLVYSPHRFIRFNHHSLLDYSLTEWAEIGVSVVSIGAMTKQELRNKLGLEYVDKKELNEFTVLENYIPIEKTGNQKKLQEGGD